MKTFTVKEISLAQVVEPDGYQRDLDPKQVAAIIDRFDAAQWDLPKVASVDKGYRVIAGQHRLEAARAFLAANDWPFENAAGYLDVQVIHGLDDLRDEADLFLKDAGNKKAIAPYFKHRAALIAGYQSAIDIQTSLDRYHVPLVRRQKVLNGATFVAISALNMIWRGSNGAKVVDETLRLRNIWTKDDHYRSDGSLIGGLGMVVRELLHSDEHVGRLERVVRSNTALSVASKALQLAAAGEGKGKSLSQPLTYAIVFRGLLPQRKYRPATPNPAADAAVVRELVLSGGATLRA